MIEPTPPKLALVNMDTEEVLRAQFNPEQLELTCRAVWNKTVIPGFSHPIKEFSHTDDTPLSFDLYFRVSTPSQDVSTTSINSQIQENFSLTDRFRAEAFLRALTVPRGGADVLASSPPTVLVVWPNFLTMEVIVEAVKFKYFAFNRLLHPTRMTASLELSDIHELRFTSEEARFQGFQMTRKPLVGTLA